MQRVAVFSALRALLASIVGSGQPFVTFSTKWVDWTQFPKESMPALFLVDEREVARFDKNAPPVWAGEFSLVIYATLPSDDTAGRAAVLNPLLDAVDAQLAAVGPGGVQTLGGLVDRIAISGDVEKYGGVTDDIVIALVPLQYTAHD